MKIQAQAVAALLLVGTVAQAADRMNVPQPGRQMSVVFAEDSAAEAAAFSPPSSVPGLPGCGETDWPQFRHGCLWEDYCLPRQGGLSVPSITANCPDETVASECRTRTARCHAVHGVNATGGRRRAGVLALLRDLLGWKFNNPRSVACHERVDCVEPIGSLQVDDPAPQPPAESPWTDPDTTGDDTTSPLEGAATVPTPESLELETTAPVDSAPEPEAPAENNREMSPVPTDDPAPQPEPEVPRNKLPPLSSAGPDTIRDAKHSSAPAGRLSDYIRTR